MSSVDLLFVEVGFSLLLRLLCSRAVRDSLPPSPVVRELLLNLGVESIALLTEDKGQDHLPRDKGQIGIGVLVANKVFGTLLFEVLVQDSKHTLDLFAVSLNC